MTHLHLGNIGAPIGAAIGSVIPGVGTAIGAGLGNALGRTGQKGANFGNVLGSGATGYIGGRLGGKIASMAQGALGGSGTAGGGTGGTTDTGGGTGGTPDTGGGGISGVLGNIWNNLPGSTPGQPASTLDKWKLGLSGLEGANNAYQQYRAQNRQDTVNKQEDVRNTQQNTQFNNVQRALASLNSGQRETPTDLSKLTRIRQSLPLARSGGM